MDTARWFVDYHQYGSEKRAIYALKKKCPDFSASEYEKAFYDCVFLHKDAIKFVEKHSNKIYKAFMDNEKIIDFRGVEDSFFKRHKQFPKAFLRNELSWVFYLYHLR